MKKGFALFVLALTVMSCNQNVESKELKTAYIDTSKLLQEYTESKDIEAKYKAQSQEMGKELDAEVARFKTDAQNFQKNAQANGQAWAQQKGAELQKREQQISYAQQAMLQQLQQESGAEMDSLVTSVRKYIKEYGKEKGYAYVFDISSTNIPYFQGGDDLTAAVKTKLGISATATPTPAKK